MNTKERVRLDSDHAGKLIKQLRIKINAIDNMQNCPRQLAMQSSALCLYVRCESSNQIKNFKKSICNDVVSVCAPPVTIISWNYQYGCEKCLRYLSRYPSRYPSRLPSS